MPRRSLWRSAKTAQAWSDDDNNDDDGRKAECSPVELKGKPTAGSITFTVAKANKRAKALVGTTVRLAVPAGAKIKAKACTTAGSSALTLRDLHVKAPHTP